MIVIPKYKDVYVPQPLNLGLGHWGEVRVKVYRPDGRCRYDSGWHPNMITNYGLRYWHNTSIFSYWTAGSGSTPPTPDDTSITPLPSAYGTGNTGVSPVYYNSGAPDYLMSYTDSKRWNAGQATGTVREFGIGSTTSGTSGVAIRHVLSTPVVKASDEVMDIYHRMWMKLSNVDIDRHSQISVEGETYDVTTRWICVDQAATNTKGQHAICVGGGAYFSVYGNNYLDPITTVNPTTTGGADTGFNCSTVTQIDNSGTSGLSNGHGWETSELVLNLSCGNFGDGTGNGTGNGIGKHMTRMISPSSSAASAIATFSRASNGYLLPKDSNKTITFTWRLEWARYDPTFGAAGSTVAMEVAANQATIT